MDKKKLMAIAFIPMIAIIVIMPAMAQSKNDQVISPNAHTQMCEAMMKGNMMGHGMMNSNATGYRAEYNENIFPIASIDQNWPDLLNMF